MLDDLQVVSTDHCPFDFKDQKALGKRRLLGDPERPPRRRGPLHAAVGRRGGDRADHPDALRRAHRDRAGAGCSASTRRRARSPPGVRRRRRGVRPDTRRGRSRRRTHHMRVDYSCYEGREVTGVPEVVLQRGKVLVERRRVLRRSPATGGSSSGSPFCSPGVRPDATPARTALTIRPTTTTVATSSSAASSRRRRAARPRRSSTRPPGGSSPSVAALDGRRRRRRPSPRRGRRAAGVGRHRRSRTAPRSCSATRRCSRRTSRSSPRSSCARTARPSPRPAARCAAGSRSSRSRAVRRRCCSAPRSTRSPTGSTRSSFDSPSGVVAGICPFNFPMMVPLWMLPLALVAGNTFVLKPSPRTPLSAVRELELLVEAGLPKGVVNLVHGDREPVEALLAHPRRRRRELRRAPRASRATSTPRPRAPASASRRSAGRRTTCS